MKLLRATARVLRHTLTGCLRYRATGLAAEVAFWAVLSLPPLVFGLAGAIGFIARRFPITEIDEIRRQMLLYAEQFLTPSTVEELIAPTVDEVLGSGRLEVVSIGFLLALWSGSRAMNVVVDGITIMYGMHGHRGIIKTRMLSLGVYAVFLLGTAVTLPLVLAGPRLTARLLPASLQWLGLLYWPIVLIATTGVLVSLLHVATPIRNYWRAHVPGAALTMALWLIGSTVLRWALITLTGSTSIFGPLATPIALLAWLYLVAIAVFVGGALNAAVAKVAPGFAGITTTEAEHVLEANDDEGAEANAPTDADAESKAI